MHGCLTQSYWAAGIPLEVVRRSIEHSLAFGLYHGGRQIGFARAVTDCATFAYLADVFVLEPFRGRGLGEWLVAAVLAHPDLRGLSPPFRHYGDVALPRGEHRGPLGGPKNTSPHFRNELRRWVLVTRDAHGLYRKHGFSPLAHPERYMDLVVPDVYPRDSPGAEPPRA